MNELKENLLENNKVYLQGTIDGEPEFSHEVKGEVFYTFLLKVARLSGQDDIIPVIIDKKLCDAFNLMNGERVAIKGQFRSFNQIINNKRKLVLSVFVKEMCEWDNDANANTIELDGFICKPSIYRTTPFAREICDVLLAVNRNYNKSDYIPCIAWGTNAQIISKLQVASNVKILGRIQSREYNKVEGDNVVTKTAYEVSIAKLLN